ncbi:ATP-binding cassette sub-family C member 4-like [Euwallacea fornicatus]|uniref:ATP-binding cassette sub-family C member 4-like n=1 Tax=Euwallacea fornicatus TaxID=995702 RepID=UPI00338F2EB3
MDFTEEHVNPNPRDKSTPLGLLFFTYTYGMFKRGYLKTLEEQDLYNPIKSDRSMLLGNRLERVWNKLYEDAKLKNKRPNLIWGIFKTFWPEYTILGITIVLMQACSLIQPLMLGNLLAYFRSDSTMTREDALIYAGAISLCAFFTALLTNQYIMGAFHYGMKIRAAACALIYRKSLRLSKTALGDVAAGKIVNLLSNDVSRFDLVTILVHHMWVSPLVTLIIMYLMWIDVGMAGIYGILIVFIVVAIQGYTGKLSAIYRKATALKTDERVRLMDEILSGIQVIKMYAWEKPFAKLIRFARKAELKIITKSSYVRGLYMAFNLFTTRLAMFATLLTIALMEQSITAPKVFVIMSYLNVVCQIMSQMFVRGISEMAELIVAIKRLEEFMLNEEYVPHSPNLNGDLATKHSVLLEDLTVKWNAKLSDNALENISMNINRGDLIGIIGPVGSGKSSLLQTILAELELVSGKIHVNGKVSYASQESWVFAATVRQNILFGSLYDKKRYQDVVRACALEKDFEQFSNGDLTIVGDRGASLSGGQKARINLARAIYRDADIYLLDDPLSAVDIHVAKHLYDLCINGYLHNKTRILVTHQVHFLKDADNIIILNNGRIENEGTFSKLSESENLYAKLLTTETEMSEEEKLKSIEMAKKDRKMSVKSIKSLVSAMSELSIPEALLVDQDEDREDEEEKREIKMKDLQEESSKGKVKGNLFWKYATSGGNIFFVLFVFLLYLLAQGTAMSVDYFVSFWVAIEDYKNSNQLPIHLQEVLNNSNSSDIAKTLRAAPFLFHAVEWERNLFLDIYGSLIVSLFALALLRSMLFYKLAMISSQKLHDSIFYSVINTAMRFFDTNPGGRILNRFSKDIGSVDELLPKAILDASQLILMALGSIILITVVKPIFLGVVAVMGAISMVFRHVYLKTSKNIKRLEGVMRSPVFTHLSATLTGLTTIRAFEAENILRNEFDKYQDGHTSAWFMFIAASSAFGLIMDMLCFTFISLVTFSFLIFSKISSSDVGLAITQATSLTMMVQWGLRQSAEVANQLMSVERVLEYKQLPPEKQPDKPIQPPKEWPQSGMIKFENVGLRYDSEGALVLKQLSFKIEPNEKVGIVGRTGAGKSSLISALFRLASVEGSIKIDEVDTNDVQLEQLRSKISIIPQDPVLFSGTLRYNLDPFDEYNDDMLYKAIEDVELNDPANIINRLENRVMDRGANYSVGQRQLICLARAIIRKNKILMLDEATANVDPQTDALIQKTIRKKFSDCTVLTVAHRLNTIMDSDKVLVMDSGTMVEFDHPHNLLKNPNSVFYNMVEEGGRAMAEQLRKMAKESFQKQHSLPE